MTRNKLVSAGVLAVFCIIFWNALDYGYTVWITHGAYSFSVMNDICLPAVIGVTVGMITGMKNGNSGK